MNLDEQLRAALNLEAEMRTAPPPDLQSVISGGQGRRRRRNATLLGGGVLAVVLVGGGILAATQLAGGPDPAPPVATQPSEGASAPQSYPTADGQLEPGTYRKVVGVHESGGRISVDLTFGTTGWLVGEHPVLELDRDFGGVTVYQAERLAGSDYCSLVADDPVWLETSRAAAGTSGGLARQLASLPSSAVVEPITTTQAFGQDAVHLRVRIEDDCSPGVYHLADTSVGTHGVSYADYAEAAPDVIVDFLVVDLDGTPVVAEYWHHPGADPDLVSEVTSVRDSISFAEPE